MVDISFKLDPEILIGKDTINRAGSLCSPFGSRILIVTEQVLYENKSIQRLVGILEDAGLEAIIFDEVPAQATADVAESVADLARGARVSTIIGFGGLKTQTIARVAAIIGKSSLSIFDLLDGKNLPGTVLFVLGAAREKACLYAEMSQELTGISGILAGNGTDGL
ncbi:hypothetical protein FACS1894200_14540 [Spirochaetia bacterium]|nr:hypothetical protein FACS1894200_14540 [Spirochaetia bacterium]